MRQHDPVFLFNVHIPVSTLKLKAEKNKSKFIEILHSSASKSGPPI